MGAKRLWEEMVWGRNDPDSKWTSSVTTLDPNQNILDIGFDGSAIGIAQSLACTRKLGKCRSSEGLRSFNPSKGKKLAHSHHFGWGY